MRPGAYKHIDPRTMDPESALRLASGLWKHEYALDTDIDTWVCDKRKLHEAVQEIMLNPSTFQQFTMDPTRFLDARFGKGTGEAYRHSGQDRVAMRFNPYTMGIDPARGRDMAYLTGTTATTWTDTSTSSTTDTWIMQHAQEQRMYEQRQRQKQQHDKKAYSKKEGHAPVRKLVRNTPFVCGAGDLLNTLQRDFDHWAKPQMAVIHG